MKTIIAGSREGLSFSVFKAMLDMVPWDITEVVSGTARGVDQLGEMWAREQDMPLTLMQAQWDTYGKAAGILRNRAMAKYADALVAICINNSKGTSNMIEEARKNGLKILSIRIDK
jgi:hypothetical protein